MTNRNNEMPNIPITNEVIVLGLCLLIKHLHKHGLIDKGDLAESIQKTIDHLPDYISESAIPTLMSMNAGVDEF